jgi:hypothetical protein
MGRTSINQPGKGREILRGKTGKIPPKAINEILFPQKAISKKTIHPPVKPR